MSEDPTSANDVAARFGSGRAVTRIEDRALLTGRGRFVDDVVGGAGAVVAFQRSPHAHARIRALDLEAARAMPGVLAVLTGADLVAAGVKPLASSQNFKRADGHAASAARHPLAHEVVRFVGEAVVAVVAGTREQARDAAEAVVVDYDELPAMTDVAAAIAAGAPALTPDAPDNVAGEIRHGKPAEVEAAFARADVRIALDLVNQRVAAVPMEPRSIAAWPETEGDAAEDDPPPAAVGEAAGDGDASGEAVRERSPASSNGGPRPTGRLVVRISNQMPTAVASGLAGALPGLAQKEIRVVVGDVGGGFGMKTGIYPEDVVVAHAARTLGRAVRWQAERSDDFVAATHGRDVASHAELALGSNGRVLALRVRSHANVGAYATPTGVAIQLLIGPWVSTSVYDIALIDLHLIAVMTNTAPTGAYRGAGRPEAIYLIERLFDAAARELRIDPSELRRRNFIAPEQMPYTNAMAQTYDSGRFAQVQGRGLALADWHGFAARREDSARRGLLRGRGIATFLEWTGGNAFEETVGVDVGADGTIEIFSATQAMGQGIATSYAQLAVDVFGVPIEKVRVVQGDTDRGNGFGSAGSRSLFTGGSAVRVAAERTVEHARALAGEALEAAAGDIEYAAGRFVVAGTDLGIDLFALAGRQPERHIRMASTSAVSGPTWPNACHVCEVEVDPASGEVRVVSYASVNDIGRVVSPEIARGQVEGGAVQGIGQALCEAVVYDASSSQLLTGSLMDYAVPRADVGIAFATEFDTSIPCALNPLGVKGVGELGTIGATPATMNALIDALDHAGLGRDAEGIGMPATSERVWRLLQTIAR